ncbi:helix-turn-helix transcriptional regulator [Amycolatopsis anabasis]|uniref:helix-turn-helix transcriptional regulator n=1 Tax=Amycolatopsis anabasis TaxID=1840409 RepID=UPI00131DDC7E|nr:response regulator transcription factor [Amycolatopsis anabasis]
MATLVVFDPYPISGLGVLANVNLAVPELTTTVLTANEEKTFERIAATDPAMVIARIEPASAVRFATEIADRYPQLPVLMLLPGTVSAQVLRAVRARGIRGLLPAHASAAELRVAIAQTYFSAAQRPASRDAFSGAESHRRPLSQRESTVLALAAEGLTNDDIARQLFLSPDTIRCHVRSVLSKLCAHNRTHAVALAYRLGLLETPSRSSPAAV